MHALSTTLNTKSKVKPNTLVDFVHAHMRNRIKLFLILLCI